MENLLDFQLVMGHQKLRQYKQTFSPSREAQANLNFQ
jgi:hypothetical protein